MLLLIVILLLDIKLILTLDLDLLKSSTMPSPLVLLVLFDRLESLLGLLHRLLKGVYPSLLLPISRLHVGLQFQIAISGLIHLCLLNFFNLYTDIFLILAIATVT